MTTLIGTEKQIAAANEIRAERIAALEAAIPAAVDNAERVLESLRNRLQRYPQVTVVVPDLQGTIREAFAAWSACDDAHTWIERRNVNASRKMQDFAEEVLRPIDELLWVLRRLKSDNPQGIDISQPLAVANTAEGPVVIIIRHEDGRVERRLAQDPRPLAVRDAELPILADALAALPSHYQVLNYVS